MSAARQKPQAAWVRIASSHGRRSQVAGTPDRPESSNMVGPRIGQVGGKPLPSFSPRVPLPRERRREEEMPGPCLSFNNTLQKYTHRRSDVVFVLFLIYLFILQVKGVRRQVVLLNSVRKLRHQQAPSKSEIAGLSVSIVSRGQILICAM